MYTLTHSSKCFSNGDVMSGTMSLKPGIHRTDFRPLKAVGVPVTVGGHCAAVCDTVGHGCSPIDHVESPAKPVGETELSDWVVCRLSYLVVPVCYSTNFDNQWEGQKVTGANHSLLLVGTCVLLSTWYPALDPPRCTVLQCDISTARIWPLTSHSTMAILSSSSVIYCSFCSTLAFRASI